jgi:hypothetical protein
LLHIHRGHVLGLRVQGKPYLVLPSAPVDDDAGDSLTVLIARAVYSQTGLVIDAFGWRHDNKWGYVVPDTQILGGTLRPNAGFFHPREWQGSPDADYLGALLTTDPAPLAYEQVRVYPHEVVPGDIYNFPIIAVRYDRNAHGEETATFQYENYSGATLGRDDAFGEDGEEAPEQEGAGGRRRKVQEKNTALGCAWGAPHDLRAQILVYRLGGDYRGEST